MAALHIITAATGSEALSLARAVDQPRWIIGPAVMVLFAVLIHLASNLLCRCHKSGDIVTGT